MKIRGVSLALLFFVATSFISPSSDAAEYKKSDYITLTVFAASSLTQSFTLIGTQFERKNPGVKVQFSFLSSGVLANQIVAGAPADVFASAAISDIKAAKIRVPSYFLFAANQVVLAFPKNGHFRINKLVDLNQKGLKWIQCTHTAPCGAVTDASLNSFGKIISKPVSYEANVASVVAKLLAGEVDAAIVYHTDFVAHKEVLAEIRFPDAVASTTQYPIGVISDSKNADLARAFVSAVTSPNGRKILAEAGFARIK